MTKWTDFGVKRRRFFANDGLQLRAICYRDPADVRTIRRLYVIERIGVPKHSELEPELMGKHFGCWEKRSKDPRKAFEDLMNEVAAQGEVVK